MIFCPISGNWCEDYEIVDDLLECDCLLTHRESEDESE